MFEASQAEFLAVVSLASVFGIRELMLTLRFRH